MAQKDHLALEPGIRRVVDLLSWTHMTPMQIAEQMKCSQTSILQVSHDFGLRNCARPAKPLEAQPLS